MSSGCAAELTPKRARAFGSLAVGSGVIFPLRVRSSRSIVYSNDRFTSATAVLLRKVGVLWHRVRSELEVMPHDLVFPQRQADRFLDRAKASDDGPGRKQDAENGCDT